MRRPLLLDLYCGVGGAAMGYRRAGFDVVGVDIERQPDYPFDFIHGDALTIGQELIRSNTISAIHASPPCQHHTTFAKGCNKNRTDFPDVIAEARSVLADSALPYVIENVPSAPLVNTITLCGEMFSLGVLRHRIFESNIPMTAPPHPAHRGRVAAWRHGAWHEGPYFGVYGLRSGGKGSVREWQDAMGIDWTTRRKSFTEAIPPAFTECIGSMLMAQLGRRRRPIRVQSMNRF